MGGGGCGSLEGGWGRYGAPNLRTHYTPLLHHSKPRVILLSVSLTLPPPCSIPSQMVYHHAWIGSQVLLGFDLEAGSSSKLFLSLSLAGLLASQFLKHARTCLLLDPLLLTVPRDYLLDTYPIYCPTSHRSLAKG